MRAGRVWRAMSKQYDQSQIIYSHLTLTIKVGLGFLSEYGLLGQTCLNKARHDPWGPLVDLAAGLKLGGWIETWQPDVNLAARYIIYSQMKT